MSDICISGGAIGADLQWGMCAGTAGHEVCHFIFDGHNSTAPKQELVTLPRHLLLEADEHCHRASKTLKKYFPLTESEKINRKGLYVRNLLRRNWYQVKDAERVYAISTIKDGLVQGGTAWAVQMYLDRHNDDGGECYVFEQELSKWFKRENKSWIEIDTPPMPHGVWAGIGTRELNSSGKDAIRNLLGYYTHGKAQNV